MRHLLLALLLLSSSAMAKKAPVLILPIDHGKNVPAASVAAYDKALKGAVSAHAKPLTASKAKQALSKSGAEATCRDDVCAGKLAEASKARFVLSTRITNSDDIYEVSLSLYDHDRRSRSLGKAVCELCAAEEVNGTVKQAVAKLEAPFKRGGISKPEPKVEALVAVEIKSEPMGATVFVDDVTKGQTPLMLKLKPGEYKLTLKKAGYKPYKHSIKPTKNKFKVTARMIKAPEPPKPASAPVVPAPAPALPPVVDAPQKDLTPTGLGFLLGGALFMGGGAWLISLDGEVTCDDGRGITECPDIYDTKWLGMGATGIGGALIGAGVATLILNPGGDAAEPSATPSVAPTDGGGVFMLSGQF